MPALYVETRGSSTAPAIVFLHGGGLSSKEWTPQIEQLSSDYYCIAPDLAEQGRSISISPFTLEASAADVAAIIRERVPNKKAHIVGLSLGGAVTITLLRTAPEVVQTAFVTGTAAGLGNLLGQIAIASAALYRFIPTKTLVNASLKQFKIPEKYRPLVQDDLAATSTSAFTRRTIEALMGMTLPTASPVPLLVAVGEKETAAARQAARTLAALPNARGVTVPSAGHVWNLQLPDLFTETVRQWVRNQSVPDSLRPL